eukprot:IDg16054t1
MCRTAYEPFMICIKLIEAYPLPLRIREPHAARYGQQGRVSARCISRTYSTNGTPKFASPTIAAVNSELAKRSEMKIAQKRSEISERPLFARQNRAHAEYSGGPSSTSARGTAHGLGPQRRKVLIGAPMAAVNSPAAIAAAQAAAVAAANGQPRMVTVAATQFTCSNEIEANLRKAEQFVREAARRGASIVLLQELFATPYFPIEQRDFFHYAIALDEDKSYIARFQNLARELNVVIPLSFYERSNNAHFNSVMVIDADGTQLGVYRKSHIPDGPGYQEKYYFSPGNTGFRVFKTRFATIGVGVCWDQWFPEAARCMALEGAEMLLFPTAIGSEPQDPALDTCTHWQRCMQGHSAANMIPVIASNRTGKEVGKDTAVSVTFYGTSFITDYTGLIVSDAGRHQETVLVHTFNMDNIQYQKLKWGVFRDRRPELYSKLFTLDGHHNLERHVPFATAQPALYAPRGLPNNSVAVAAAAAASMPCLTLPGPKKLETDAIMAQGMMTVDGDTTACQRM